jgi:thioredoxin 1
MNKYLKIFVPVSVIAVAAVLIAVKESGRPPAEDTASPAGSGRGIPTLIDLGADRCVPCIKMAPILKELKEEYRGKLEVIFIDVWKDRTAGQKYGIRLIPTQIFYDGTGKELGRHEGFIGKEEILNTFRRFGVEIPAPGKEGSER